MRLFGIKGLTNDMGILDSVLLRLFMSSNYKCDTAHTVPVVCRLHVVEFVFTFSRVLNDMSTTLQYM